MKADYSAYFFQECPEDWRDGYLIMVRNRLSDTLEKEYLPKEYKSKYIEDWGEEVIYDDQFLDWYCEQKKPQKR